MFGTIAAHFNDDGVSGLYFAVKSALESHGLSHLDGALAPIATKRPSRSAPILPTNRQGYLAEISAAVREYHARTTEFAEVSRTRQHVRATEQLAKERGVDLSGFDQLRDGLELDEASRRLLEDWPKTKARYLADEFTAESRAGSGARRRDEGRCRGPKSPASPCPATQTMAIC